MNGLRSFLNLVQNGWFRIVFSSLFVIAQKPCKKRLSSSPLATYATLESVKCGGHEDTIMIVMTPTRYLNC